MNTSSRINPILNSVDEKSRRIITYMLRERHAGIRELSNLISASSDMEVLMRIKDIINPKAQRFIGKPIITFEQSKTDFSTGEKVLFSWWTNEEADSVDNEHLVEVMEEENLLRIVAAVPPQEENVDITVAGSILIISGEKYYQEVPLCCPVEKAAKKILHNGVLEVKLNKLCDEKCQ